MCPGLSDKSLRLLDEGRALIFGRELGPGVLGPGADQNAPADRSQD
jgi:hypothetical protein